MAEPARQAAGVTYERAIVAFLDILGFRSIIATKTAEEVACVLRVTRRLSDGEGGGGRDPEVRTFCFSDSIVRVRRTDSVDPVHAELNDLALAQGELVKHKVLLRGAVTLGEVYHDGQAVVFGPAFNKAYDLESTFAIYPRIVVDPALLREVGRGTFENQTPYGCPRPAAHTRASMRSRTISARAWLSASPGR